MITKGTYILYKLLSPLCCHRSKSCNSFKIEGIAFSDYLVSYNVKRINQRDYCVVYNKIILNYLHYLIL